MRARGGEKSPLPGSGWAGGESLCGPASFTAAGRCSPGIEAAKTVAFPQKQTVRFFAVYVDGRLREISTRGEKLLRYGHLGARRVRIEAQCEQVPVVQAKLYDWGSRQQPRLKLHWHCPDCGAHHWGDWTPEEENPCLWFNNCQCTDKVLLFYDQTDVFPPAETGG